MYNSENQKDLFVQSKSFLSNPATVQNIEILRNLLRYHEWKYYIDNQPVISDFEYDQLYKQLEAIEQSNPSLITSDSPTQRVSTDLISDFNTVKHIIPMLSLENSYNADDLNDFDTQIKKLCNLDANNNVQYVVEPKYDGGSVALNYENDLLVRAATRGNGQEGEEITLNLKSLSSIPLRANFSKYGIQSAELRGEALISKSNFIKANKVREEEGLVLFANPRNAATGGLRTKDPNETRKRGIEAFIFQLGYAVDIDQNSVFSKFNNHFDNIELLGQLGFKIPISEKRLCNGIAEVISFCNEWQEKRDEFEYEIDGMVVKVNDYKLQELCGSTAHHPRWAIAFKFKAKQATSKLIAVEYQVGKIGSITPVAKIQPVSLAGVTVSSISLHNEDFIKSKDLRLGDTVLVERAGDVIPYIVKPLEDLRDGSEEVINFPKYCPSNKSENILLVQEEGEAAWRCNNCTCGAQNLQKIIFHVSKEAMNIDGFGKSIVEKFYDLGFIKDISDVYNLDFEKISNLEGFGKKSADKLNASIDNAKSNPLNKLLHSLSIHHLGKKASKVIAEHIESVLDLRSWSKDRFLEIKDIGPVVAENVSNWFANEANINLIKKLENFGVNIYQTEEDKPISISSNGPLVGKTILFTGTLSQMGRKEAEDLAAKNGAKNISSVSSNLNILVIGEKAGSKLAKARTIGTIQILTEEEFINMIN
jgi:DNA ligase (NAD+)